MAHFCHLSCIGYPVRLPNVLYSITTKQLGLSEWVLTKVTAHDQDPYSGLSLSRKVWYSPFNTGYFYLPQQVLEMHIGLVWH